ncbi:hypothetical protein [Mixta theicola]|nr:hypothetical protein [Mixta theicola]
MKISGELQVIKPEKSIISGESSEKIIIKFNAEALKKKKGAYARPIII